MSANSECHGSFVADVVCETGTIRCDGDPAETGSFADAVAALITRVEKIEALPPLKTLKSDGSPTSPP